MFTENELRHILAHWDVPQDLPILDVYIMDGSKISGSVWSVGDEMILKTGDRAKLLQNLKVAKALSAQGFTAPAPIPTKPGEEYLNGDQPFVLTRGVKGCPLPKSDRFGENRWAFGIKYGQSIARLHNALAAVEADICPDEVNLYRHVTERALPQVQKQNLQWQMGLPDSFFTSHIHSFGAVFEKLPKQLIHRDPNPSNILFDGGEVSGLIDFDLSERNIRLWDPCYCATGILCEWDGVDGIQEKWPSILDGILHGYDSVNPLTKEEKQAIFNVLCSIQIICVAYFESVDKSEYKALARTNRDMLRFIADQEQMIRNIF